MIGNGECDNEPRWKLRNPDYKKKSTGDKEETGKDFRNGGVKIT